MPRRSFAPIWPVIPVMWLAACADDLGADDRELPDHPTWDNAIASILAEYCNTCHGPEPRNQAPGFFRTDVYEDVVGAQGAWSYRQRVLARVRDDANPMPPPPAPGPTAAEIEVIGRWVEQGAPRNAEGPR